MADAAEEPLNLVEVGCSAGVLLDRDKYAYRLEGGGRVGAADAPLTLSLAVTGGKPLRIPRIGIRIGLDLHVVNVRSEDERRWLLALSFPEHRQQQAALATALNVVAQTPIRMIEGDALDSLPAVLAETPDPLCVLHSACSMYWSSHAKRCTGCPAGRCKPQPHDLPGGHRAHGELYSRAERTGCSDAVATRRTHPR